MGSGQTGKIDGASEKPSQSTSVPRTRSPNFPALSLRKAVEKTEALHKIAKKFPVDTATALKHLGHSSTVSSNALQTLGALKAYGLIESDGSGDARKVRVSDTGALIVLDHPDRAKLLKTAAILPPLFAQVWAMQNDDGLPPDESIRRHLLFDLQFNESAIPTFISSFRDTLAFAGLTAGDKMNGEGQVSAAKNAGSTWGNTPSPTSLAFKVGDFVQWTCNGVDVFAEPRPIRGFHGAEHAYFEPNGAGVAPVKELTMMDAPTPAPPGHQFREYAAPAPRPSPDMAGYKTDTAYSAGTREFPITLPSLEIAYIRVPVPMSEEDFDMLGRMLDAMKKKLVGVAPVTSKE